MSKTSIRILAICVGFALAIGGTFFFAYRAGREARRIRSANEPVRAWMSIPFAAHAHHVPPEALFQAIGVQPRQPHDRRSIRRLARDLNRPVPEILSQVQRAIDAARQSPGQPPGGQPK